MEKHWRDNDTALLNLVLHSLPAMPADRRLVEIDTTHADGALCRARRKWRGWWPRVNRTR